MLSRAKLSHIFRRELSERFRRLTIDTLAGWDSDNPTATWGGLLGFMMSETEVRKTFANRNLSQTFHIHRTRRNFPDHTPQLEGEDSFGKMAERTLAVIDRVVVQEMGGEVDHQNNSWSILLP